MSQWHIITCEYPPQPGGVSDYTQLVANGLAAAGDEVHVWCPTLGESSEVGDQKAEVGGQRSDVEREAAGVVVHRALGRISPADLRRVGKMLDEFPAPRRLLVQWVPQGYNYRSMNLPFCFWLKRRAKHKNDRVELMVHEPFLPFREGSKKQDVAAAVHRLMIVTLLQAASHVWVSIPDWEKQLRQFARGNNKTFGWLPVPSNIPVIDDPEGVATVRERYTSKDGFLIGHFGAYDRYMTELMLKLLPALLDRQDNLSVLLLGKGSVELRDRMVDAHPELAKSVHATGMLSAEDVSRHVSACDLMLQPYEDGVSGRRTSVMTSLSHGTPVVTMRGKASESCWHDDQAVRLTNNGDAVALLDEVQSLLGDASERERLSAAGRALYEQRFALVHAIASLQRLS